ncbi:MAG TPA: hypothetical protein VGO03_14660 [Acidimicrobiia bacterium]|jgi:hypothetical protein
METLAVRPLLEPATDTFGHDPRSWYSETFWLPTIGPTCLLLLRRMADGFDRNPEGFEVPASALASALGISESTSPNAPLQRSLRRLEQFSLLVREPPASAGEAANTGVLIRRYLPAINRRHIRRLPEPVRALQHEWAEAQLTRPIHDSARGHARRIALCLLGEGDSPDLTERSLARIGFSSELCRDAIDWAMQRHLDAARAVAS